jgi:hypothetical protein
MMRHRYLLAQGRVEESRHPLASRFILGCLSWIEEYNNTPHSGEGMDGGTPDQVFDAERDPHQRPAPDAATLALLLSDRETRGVRECAVQFRNRRYTPRPEDREAWAAMHHHNEREILVAYDAADLSTLAALDAEGHFLAHLEAEELIRFAPGDTETQQRIGKSFEIRRGLEKATRATITAISTEARANGAQSAEEALYTRLQLPDTTAPAIAHRPARRARQDKIAVAPSTAADIASQFLEGLK